MKDLDINNDGIFNNQDTAWNEVKVWKDLNTNGILEEGELLSLESVNVSGINLGYTNSTDVDSGGNSHLQKGSFIKTDGSTGSVNDVWFDVDKSNTIYDKVVVSDDIKALPNLNGFGNVVSLHEAMVLDTTGELKALVQSYVNTVDKGERLELMKQIMFQWTGVQEIDPASRAIGGSNYIGDARILEALEVFWGEEYINRYWLGSQESNPRHQASQILIKTFEDLCTAFDNAIMTSQQNEQNPISTIKVRYDDATQTINVNVSAFINEIIGLYGTDIDAAISKIRGISILVQERSLFAEEIVAAVRKAGEALGEHPAAYNLKQFASPNLFITNGSDTIYGTSGNDYIDALDGNDFVYAGGGNDIINGELGDDKLYAGDGKDNVEGGDGRDRIYGEKGDDTIIGGSGDDQLVGGDGNDTYKFSANWGHDTIDNSSYDEVGAYNDVIKFLDYNSTDIVIKRDENDLILSTIDGNNTIRVFSYFLEAGETNNTISQINFADGVIWDYGYVIDKWNRAPESFGGVTTIEGTSGNESINGTYTDDIIIGGRGDDTIYARDGNDVLFGGRGDDRLEGDSGNDTYIYNLGDGFDTIYDDGNDDVISFGVGINLNDLKFSCDGGGLRISIKNDETQGLLLQSFFSSLYYKIEKLSFNDGTIFRLSEVGLKLEQSDESESVYGTSFADIIYGNKGNDTINDGGGDDTIIGGKGNDVISGGSGNNAYIYNLGDGFDTISETEGVNKIKFGEGITIDKVIFESNNGNLCLYVNADKNEGIKILNQYSYSTSSKIESLEFSDGSTLDITGGLTFKQRDCDENITTSGYDDIINAGAGNDIVNAKAGNDIILGDNGHDTLNGDDGNDMLTGGIGCDNLNGGYGDDTYIYKLGDGFDIIYEVSGDGNDKIIFDEISITDLSVQQLGSDLIFTTNGDKDSGIRINSHFGASLYRIETLEFSDAILDISQYSNADQLVQAMASFGASSSVTGDITMEELNIVDNLIAVNYKNVA